MLRSAGKRDSVVTGAHRKSMTTVSWGGCKTVQGKGLQVGRCLLDKWVLWGDGERSWRS